MTYFPALRARNLLFAASALALLAISPARAQDSQQEEEDNSLDSIVVTATAIRQGGAQDIKHFRSVSLDGSFLPETKSLTMEGLMGEHDLTLPALAPCRQTFCLTGHAMRAGLPLRPQDQWFVGLGFTSNIDAGKWRAEPLSLIAVVDRSGSMSGEIGRVKQALHAALNNLRDGDRIGIVHYGSEPLVHLEVTEVKGNRDAIHKAIDAIEIEGSTAMEEGLEKGYEVALAELARSRGKTRLMLFTDENPNVGDTSAEGFMGQAIAGSEAGVGLTTIGVGVHFDAELATHVSSVRGGNLFFLGSDADVRQLFDREFFNMVSEVAHDVELAFTPPPGYKVTGVFGVPDGLMKQAPEGTVTVRIATAFLSSNGGGIYLTLGKDESRKHLPEAELPQGVPLLTGTLAYRDARTGAAGADQLTVAQAADDAPAKLRVAHALVDEYVTLSAALDGYHQGEDKKGAFHLINGLSQRLSSASLPGMAEERKLVDSLRDRAAYVAGYAGEMPKALRPLKLKGEWDVLSQTGLSDIARGDTVEINEDNEFITYRERGDDVYQDVRVNENQIHLDDADLTFNYRLSGDQLTLVTTDGMAKLRLRRVSDE
jgi:Ca-activated chloride channel homolog